MHEAHTTGVPAVRGLVLENQNDSTTWSTSTQYEFLLGQVIFGCACLETRRQNVTAFIFRKANGLITGTEKYIMENNG